MHRKELWLRGDRPERTSEEAKYGRPEQGKAEDPQNEEQALEQVAIPEVVGLRRQPESGNTGF